mmetsp:Transcript_15386/g.39260  ORF Transcript_15386/g.39260 Transcript_15386/m.39260 type:complete len:359 (-) Transcript_15386:24-1100(-)
MTSYSPAVLRSKINKLTGTEEDIQTLSQWIIFHRRRHASTSADLWAQFVLADETDASKLLVLLYLANDIVQVSKRKGQELCDAFASVFPRTLPHLYARCGNTSNRKRVARVMQIWREREVFTEKQLQSWTTMLPTNSASSLEQDSLLSNSSASSARRAMVASPLGYPTSTTTTHSSNESSSGHSTSSAMPAFTDLRAQTTTPPPSLLPVASRNGHPFTTPMALPHSANASLPTPLHQPVAVHATPALSGTSPAQSTDLAEVSSALGIPQDLLLAYQMLYKAAREASIIEASPMSSQERLTSQNLVCTLRRSLIERLAAEESYHRTLLNQTVFDELTTATSPKRSPPEDHPENQKRPRV